MALEIKLYVHGVPSGQKTWNVEKEDSRFISNFYSGSIDTPWQMKVEVRNTESGPFAYYTFLRGGKVVDSGRRTGSYFAMTLRLNFYHKDLRGLYNILETAYRTNIVGSLLSDDGSKASFLVDGFDAKKDELKRMEDSLVKYINYFSASSQIAKLSDIKSSGSKCANANPADINEAKYYAFVKEGVCVSVSSLYPTNKVALEAKKWEERLNNERGVWASEREKIKCVHEEEVKGLKSTIKEKEDKISSIKAECLAEHNRKVAEIESKYENQIDGLNSTIKEKDDKIRSIKSECEAKHKEKVAEIESKCKKDIEGLQSTIKEKDDKIRSIKNECEEKHKKEVEEIKSRYESKISDLNLTIKEKDDKIRSIKNECEETHKKDVAKIESEYKNQISTLNLTIKERDDEIANIKNQLKDAKKTSASIVNNDVAYSDRRENKVSGGTDKEREYCKILQDIEVDYNECMRDIRKDSSKENSLRKSFSTKLALHLYKFDRINEMSPQSSSQVKQSGLSLDENNKSDDTGNSKKIIKDDKDKDKNKVKDNDDIISGEHEEKVENKSHNDEEESSADVNENERNGKQKNNFIQYILDRISKIKDFFCKKKHKQEEEECDSEGEEKFEIKKEKGVKKKR